MKSFDPILIKAINRRICCTVTITSGERFDVEPHIMFSKDRQRFIRGYDPAEHRWRDFECNTVAAFEMNGIKFDTRQGYDPHDKRSFPLAHLWLPRAD